MTYVIIPHAFSSFLLPHCVYLCKDVSYKRIKSSLMRKCNCFFPLLHGCMCVRILLLSSEWANRHLFFFLCVSHSLLPISGHQGQYNHVLYLIWILHSNIPSSCMNKCENEVLCLLLHTTLSTVEELLQTSSVLDLTWPRSSFDPIMAQVRLKVMTH